MNQELIDNFTVLVNYYKKIKDVWRMKSYQKAILAIKNLDFVITDVKQVKKIPNIGKSISEKIQEYLEYGYISKAEEFKTTLNVTTDKERILNMFQNIWGVGPVKAQELYDLGYTTLDELRENEHILTTNQKIGLKYYDDFLKPIPRDYIYIFELMLKTVIIYELGKQFELVIAGSYRRGAKQSGDIDCLVTSDTFTLNDLVKVLIDWNIVTEVLSMRNEKFMGVVHCPNNQWFYFRMDIEFLPKEEWGSGLLYFTGSKEYNLNTRITAKKKGMVLNEHGLFKNDHRLPLHTEQEIVEYLGLPYVKPEKR